MEQVIAIHFSYNGGTDGGKVLVPVESLETLSHSIKRAKNLTKSLGIASRMLEKHFRWRPCKAHQKNFKKCADQWSKNLNG